MAGCAVSRDTSNYIQLCPTCDVYATIPRPSIIDCSCGGGGGSNRVFSAIMRWKPMPTPSMTASRIAQPMAPLRTALAPPRTASEPPVKKPAMIAFQGSSFLLLVGWVSEGYKGVLEELRRALYRIPLTAQSNVEKRPPHTPKFPPNMGARALMAVIAGLECQDLGWEEKRKQVLPPMRRSP